MTPLDYQDEISFKSEHIKKIYQKPNLECEFFEFFDEKIDKFKIKISEEMKNENGNEISYIKKSDLTEKMKIDWIISSSTKNKKELKYLIDDKINKLYEFLNGSEKEKN